MLIIGNFVSPYARKALVAAAVKQVDFELSPLVPFFGNDEFAAVSPLRRIPVLIDGDLVVNDSTIIGEYLDEAYPGAPLFPTSPADRARARWIEEYCDSRMGEAIIWKLFFQRIIRRFVWKQETDTALVAQAIDEDLPAIMDWLEGIAPDDGFLFGTVMMADITPACFMRNAALAGWTIDAARWPKSAAWINRVWATPEFAHSIAMETIEMTTPRAEQADAMRAAGVKLSSKSYGNREPKRGVLISGVYEG